MRIDQGADLHCAGMGAPISCDVCRKIEFHVGQERGPAHRKRDGGSTAHMILHAIETTVDFVDPTAKRVYPSVKSDVSSDAGVCFVSNGARKGFPLVPLNVDPLISL